MLCYRASLAFSIWRAASAVECGQWYSHECLGDKDHRYDAEYPIGIIDQDAKWKHWEGFWSGDIKIYDKDGNISQPAPFAQAPDFPPYRKDNIKAFFNHTLAGSRFTNDVYYVYAPPDAAFCSSPVVPPQMNSLSRAGGVCGVNGVAFAGGLYGTSTYEKNGAVDVFGGYGTQRSAGIGLHRWGWVDPHALLVTMRLPGQSNVGTSVCVSHNKFSSTTSQFLGTGDTAEIQSRITAEFTRVTVEGFRQGIEQAYADYNVLPGDQVQGGVLPMGTVSLEPDSYPSEEEWCRYDPACSTSPYQEPEGTLKAWVIALLVIVIVVLLIIAFTIFHWYRMKQQSRRYRQTFIKRIAENVKLEGTLEILTEEQLAEEFKRIDASNDGYIQKAELKEFLDSGKAGKLSDPDFHAMWAALDLNKSGKVDFMEFCAFLSQCGGEYDEAAARSKSRGVTLQRSASAIASKTSASSLEAGNR